MKVVVPYSKVSQETVVSLGGHHAEFINVSDSDTTYFDLLNELWGAQETFAVVEQDIVVTPGVLESFDECAHTWCAAGYPYLGSTGYRGLGCCRFRASLMIADPTLMDRVALHEYEGHCRKHWCVLDASIQRELWAVGRRVCTAHGDVGHLHDRPSHGCVPAYA